MSSLSDDIFDELTKLTMLNLHGNALTSLSDDIFDELTNLTELYLRSNGFTSLPADIFDELTELTKLYLGYNEFTSLPAGIFDELTELTELDLQFQYLSPNLTLTSLPADIFDELTELTKLYLNYNALSSLPAGIFDELTALKTLDLSNNELTSLPDGTFNNLTNLTTLDLADNTVDPMQLTVSLEKGDAGQFKAVAPTGAPFDLVLSLAITNGSISSGADSITISKGSVESDALTVTRTVGTTAAVTADIGDPLPGLPQNHEGYTFVKSGTLPLEIFAVGNGAPALNIATLLNPATLKNLDPQTLEAKLDALRAESDGSLRYLQAIALLESVLASLRPEETQLLANYPNPFNPETWIPYHLANAGAVRIRIYDARGSVVRRLDLGHKREGYYTSRSRAAYWDGRNDLGERVSSGPYFYELAADDASFFRKMLILK